MKVCVSHVVLLLKAIQNSQKLYKHASVVHHLADQFYNQLNASDRERPSNRGTAAFVDSS